MGVGATDAPGETDGVGVDGGRTGAVGQLANAGLNGVGDGVGETASGEALGLAVAEAPAPGLVDGEAEALGFAVGDGVAVGSGVGVTT